MRRIPLRPNRESTLSIKTSKPLALTIFLIATFFPWVTLAHTVLIDLGDNFSDMSASNWNTAIFNQAIPDLVDDTGATTGISFTPLFWGGDFQNGSNWIEDTDWVSVEAATDHFGGFSNSTITFGNLDGLYKIEVVCSHPQTNHLTDITINDLFSDGNFQNIPGVNGDDFDPEQDGRVAKNWLIWDSVTPINGDITLRVIKLAGTNAISVSAIRLTRVGDLPTSSAGLTSFVSPSTLPEPGGDAEFTVRIDNTGDTSIDITSLTDDVLGNLDGQGDCSLPQSIGVGSFYMCAVTTAVSGNAGDSETHTFNASGSGSAGAVSGNDSSTIDITDVLPTAQLLKYVACGDRLEEPGGDFTFHVQVNNTSVETIDLTDLFDAAHGDLNGQGDCSVPQTIAAGGNYRCTYTASFTGVSGDSENSTTTATFEDDEANTDAAEGTASVAIVSAGTSLFAGCFETGDTSEWSQVK